MVITKEGAKLIFEVVDDKLLMQRKLVEQLEISRRYWAQREVNGWKIVVEGE